jgi:hypothetical protein
VVGVVNFSVIETPSGGQLLEYRTHLKPRGRLSVFADVEEWTLGWTSGRAVVWAKRRLVKRNLRFVVAISHHDTLKQSRIILLLTYTEMTVALRTRIAPETYALRKRELQAQRDEWEAKMRAIEQELGNRAR